MSIIPRTALEPELSVLKQTAGCGSPPQVTPMAPDLVAADATVRRDWVFRLDSEDARTCNISYAHMCTLEVAYKPVTL